MKYENFAFNMLYGNVLFIRQLCSFGLIICISCFLLIIRHNKLGTVHLVIKLTACLLALTLPFPPTYPLNF